jgi:hypothetical protein
MLSIILELHFRKYQVYCLEIKSFQHESSYDTAFEINKRHRLLWELQQYSDSEVFASVSLPL